MHHLHSKDNPQELQSLYQTFKESEEEITGTLLRYSEQLFDYGICIDSGLSEVKPADLIGIASTLKQVTSVLKLAQYGREKTSLKLDKIGYEAFIIAKGGK